MFTAPSVKPGFFLYFDPIDTLAPEIQATLAAARPSRTG